MTGFNTIEEHGIKTYRLTVTKEGHTTFCHILPEYGANMCVFGADDMRVIDYDPNLIKAHDYTGTPILYPTPNRVRDGFFTFDGREYRYNETERSPYEHGLVHYLPFTAEAPLIEEDAVSVKLWVDFKPGTRQYEAFPFEHRFAITYRLTALSVSAVMSIENNKCERLPFGYALHPYFMKLDGEDGTLLKLPSETYMEATPELLPTGKLLSVHGTKYDISTLHELGGLDVDTVYTNLTGRESEIIYKKRSVRVTLLADESFTHIVAYTPPGMPFFCVENQTCSTDAHNMYNNGFKEESGLIIAGREGYSGEIRYTIHFIA